MAIGVFIFEAVPFILEDLPADRTAPGIGDGETVVPDLGQHHSSVAGVVANLLAMRHAVRERLKPPKPCRADAAKATYYPAHGLLKQQLLKHWRPPQKICILRGRKAASAPREERRSSFQFHFATC